MNCILKQCRPSGEETCFEAYALIIVMFYGGIPLIEGQTRDERREYKERKNIPARSHAQ